VQRNADGQYENAVYVTSDNPPSSTAPVWHLVGSTTFSPKLMPIVSRLTVKAGQVFAGGDGFLRQCLIVGAAWNDVPGLPLLSNGDGESVSGLASDGSMLYVGIAARGLWSWKIGGDFSMQPISVNAVETSNLPSLLINGVRFLDGRIWVTSSAGLSVAAPAVATEVPIETVSGGGCSIGRPGKPDPVLWLMVIAAWILVHRHNRRKAKTLSYSASGRCPVTDKGVRS
jgi:hypothetical protein